MGRRHKSCKLRRGMGGGTDNMGRQEGGCIWRGRFRGGWEIIVCRDLSKDQFVRPSF